MIKPYTLVVNGGEVGGDKKEPDVNKKKLQHQGVMEAKRKDYFNIIIQRF